MTHWIGIVMPMGIGHRPSNWVKVKYVDLCSGLEQWTTCIQWDNPQNEHCYCCYHRNTIRWLSIPSIFFKGNKPSVFICSAPENVNSIRTNGTKIRIKILGIPRDVQHYCYRQYIYKSKHWTIARVWMIAQKYFDGVTVTLTSRKYRQTSNTKT